MYKRDVERQLLIELSMLLSMRGVLRFCAILCVVLLLVESTDADNDAFWGRRRSDRRRRWFSRRRRKVVVASTSTCPRTHVVKLSDARDAAAASAHVYNKNTPVNSQVANTGYYIKKVIQPANLNLKAIVADKGRTRMIVFRGTNGASQLLEQAIKGFQNAGGAKDYNVRIGNNRVKVLTFTWDGNNALLKGLLSYTKDASKKYILTGHSLGGALASLFGLVVKFKAGNKLFLNRDSCIITFGAPRMGNSAFANLHDNQIAPNRKIRFVYKRDLAPHVPVTVGGASFIHHSREVWIGTKYLLHRTWRNFFSYSARNTNAWRICKDKDTNSCSNGLPWSYLFSDHGMKNYIRALKSRKVPKTFEDKNERKHTSWDQAWRCSNKK